MKSKHTPGPWIVNEDNGATYIEREAREVCRIDPAIDRKTVAENNANAHLIAAAPALLEACKAVLLRNLIDWTLPSSSGPARATEAQFEAQDYVKLARAAIARAEGGAA